MSDRVAELAAGAALIGGPDRTLTEDEVRAFDGWLLMTFCVLGLVLLLTTTFQVRFGLLPLAPATARADSPDGTATRQVWSACMVNCGSRCPLLLTVTDGQVTRVDAEPTGGDDTELPQIRACVRGRAIRQRIHNADRLKLPMRRVGPRGRDVPVDPDPRRHDRRRARLAVPVGGLRALGRGPRLGAAVRDRERELEPPARLQESLVRLDAQRRATLSRDEHGDRRGAGERPPEPPVDHGERRGVGARILRQRRGRPQHP